MLKWLVFGLGALMSVAGGAWLWQGLGIVQVERGWSAVIAGAIFVGSGATLLGLAALLRAIETLGAPRRAPAQAGGALATPVESARTVEPARPASPVMPKATTPDFSAEPADEKEGDDWRSILARTSAPSPSTPSPSPSPASAPFYAPTASPSQDGRLARRYESQGVRYSLFDDGTIEAETDSGRFTFASIDELRAFLDARKAARKS